MPKRKLFIRGQTYFITTRTEEGLPFVPTFFMNLILEDILCRAAAQYNISVCHFIWTFNHLHILLVAQDPEHVDNFMQYIKRESAHAINRLLGRRKRTIWCKSCDSPIVLDPEQAMKRIVYIYTNPQKDNLIDYIENWPCFSSWQQYVTGEHTLTRKRICRDNIPALKSTKVSISKQHRITDVLLDNSCEEFAFVLEPDAWMSCFPELEGADREELNQTILQTIRQVEAQLAKDRNTPVPNAEQLRCQDMARPYTPEKWGIKTSCLSSFKDFRVSFIRWFDGKCQEAAESYEQFRKGGDWASSFPPGFFMPGGVIRANLCPWVLHELRAV